VREDDRVDVELPPTAYSTPRSTKCRKLERCVTNAVVRYPYAVFSNMAVSFDVEDTAFKALQLRDASKLNQLLESRQGLIRHPFKNRGGRTLVHLAAQDGCTLCLCKLLKTRGCELLVYKPKLILIKHNKYSIYVNGMED
jgi:hypothetical protein